MRLNTHKPKNLPMSDSLGHDSRPSPLNSTLGQSSARTSATLPIEVRFPKGFDQLIEAELNKPMMIGGERACFGLISFFADSRRIVLTVRELRSIPDSDYAITSSGTSWTSTFMARVITDAMKLDAGVLLIHSHGYSRRPSLSSVDERSFATLLVRLRSLLPDRPHGSVVVGKGLSLGGKIALPGSRHLHPTMVDHVRWINSPVIDVPTIQPDLPTHVEYYDRQTLLIGQHGQALLNNSVLGVVGLGGGGSHVVQQATHAGFGTLVLIDPDEVEPTNMSRLAGAASTDIGRSKTEVFAQVARHIRPDVVVRTVPERFPSESGIRELRNADVVISCLDSLTARLEVQKFSWRYLIPVVDIGIGTRLSKEENPARVESIAGHVHVYLPGGACMWCSGLLSRDKIAAESGGKGPEYVEGAVNPAQIVSINGVVASLALTEAMQIVTGFMVRSSEDFLRTYDAVAGQLFSIRPPFKTCPHTATELGAGTPSSYSPSKSRTIDI